LFFPIFHSLVAEKSHEHDENGLVREKKKRERKRKLISRDSMIASMSLSLF